MISIALIVSLLYCTAFFLGKTAGRPWQWIYWKDKQEEHNTGLWEALFSLFHFCTVLLISIKSVCEHVIFICSLSEVSWYEPLLATRPRTYGRTLSQLWALFPCCWLRLWYLYKKGEETGRSFLSIALANNKNGRLLKLSR